MVIYEFGHFQLNTVERRLFRGEQVVPLSAKLFDILLLLVQNSNRLLTKEDLMKSIWSNTTVEENNLTVSISHLRKLLDEAGKERSYIQTVSKHGYRFAAAVKVFDSEKLTRQTEQNALPTNLSESGGASDSIAVLPFENVNAESSLEYLCDGVTESIIYSLSTLPQLKVMARNTVFRYKDGALDARQIGNSLRVRTILTGRIVQIEDNLIVKTELINVADGSLIWGEQYLRKTIEILNIQEEISKTISEKLKLKLSGEEEQRLIKRYTSNTEAYQNYLKGRYFSNKFDEESLKKSLVYFQRAIIIDVNYALAYAGSADSHFRLSSNYVHPKIALPQAKAMAIKAINLDSRLAEAYVSLGTVKLFYEHDWRGAEADYKQALEINPNLALTHSRYANSLVYLGRFDEALAEFEICQELDPISPQVGYANCLALMEKYEQAFEQINKTLDLNPNYYSAYLVLGRIHLHQGAHQKAIAQFKHSFQLEENNFALGLLGYAYAVSGKNKEAAKILENLKKRSTQQYVSPYYPAIIFAGLGEKEKVFEHLEKLFDEHSDWLAGLSTSPELKSLRADTRFLKLLERVGMS